MSHIAVRYPAGREKILVRHAGPLVIGTGFRLLRVWRGALGLLVMLFLSLSALPASACTCGWSNGPEDFVADVGILFRGALIAKENVQPPLRGNCKGGVGPECASTPTGRFRVDQALKGTLGATVNVIYSEQDGVNCGASFRIGQVVLVAAYGDAERGYHTSMCTQAPVSREDVAAPILAAAERYRQKLAFLDAEVAANPSNPEPLLARARFLGGTNGRIEALATLDRLLQLQPLHREGILLKAELLSIRSRDDEALVALAPLLDASPGDADALHRRIVSLLRLNRLSEVPPEWRDFSDVVVDGVDFAGRALDRANFRRAEMNEVSFAGADLRAADFSDARLRDADFSRAQLADANFTRARLAGNFTGADLQGADLSGALLRVDFSHANLTHARLSGVNYNRPGSLNGANAVALRADGARFDALDFSGADLSGADFRGVTFYSPQMIGTNLRGADLSGATFKTGGEGPGNLSGADLTSVNLDGTTLVALVYDCATRWPDGFDPADHLMLPAKGSEACAKMPDFAWLREPKKLDRHRKSGDANFSDQDLSGASFRGAWLPGERFWNAILKGADFAHAEGEADLRGADLRGADLSYVDLYKWNFRAVSGKPTDIEGAKFRGAIIHLRGFIGDEREAADLSKADLRGAIIADDPSKWPKAIDPVKAGVLFRDSASAARLFPGYDLRGADMRGFNLFQFKFTGLDLTGADMRGAYLGQVDLTGANLSGAKLKGACYQDLRIWPEGFDAAAAGVIFCSPIHFAGSYKANEVSSQWANSDGGLKNISRAPPPAVPVPSLAGENWDEARFLAAWLPGANMDGGSFVHTNLKAANLIGASMRGANMTGVNLRDALVDQADLTGASLRDADLRTTSLNDANLEGVDVMGAVYDEITVWPAGFDPAASGAVKEP